MARDLTNTSALHNGLVHDAIDIDCHTQHGSALSKSTVNRLHHEIDFTTAVGLFLIPVLSTGPAILLCSVSPLTTPCH